MAGLIANGRFALVAMLMATLCLLNMDVASCAGSRQPPSTIKFYLQQEFGTNEFSMVPPARPPVAGSFGAGFGSEVVYEFVMTKTANPNSTVLGYVRGTAISVNNTVASTTFFVQNVIHFNFYRGTLVQQGEAIFGATPWEFSIVGGTGVFRNVYGYNVGTFISSSTTPAGKRHIVTSYTANIKYR